jgi:uncharacterized membrane protein
MIGERNIEMKIGQYLRKVNKRLKSSPPAERQEILSNLRQHIYEGLSAKSSGVPNHDDLKAVLAEMDSPEMYGEKFETPSSKHEESAAVRRRHLSILALVLLLFGIVSPVLIALFAGWTGLIGSYLIVGAPFIMVALILGIVTWKEPLGKTTVFGSIAFFMAMIIVLPVQFRENEEYSIEAPVEQGIR